MNTIILYTRNKKYIEDMINYYQKVLFPTYIHVNRKSNYSSGNISLIIAFPSRIYPIKMFNHIYNIAEKELHSFTNGNIAYDFTKLIKNKLLLAL